MPTGIRSWLPALLILAAVILCQCGSAFAGNPGRQSILIVYPFSRPLPYNEVFFSGLSDVLKPFDLNSFEIFQENLDMDIIESDEYLDSLARLFISKYATKRFDAIVPFGGKAHDFLLRLGSSFSPGTPVVPVLSSRDRHSSEIDGRKIFPVISDVDVKGTLDLILHLQPGVRRIFVVSGAHPFERVAWNYVRRIALQSAGGTEFVFLTENHYDELLDIVAGLNANDAILFLSFFRDVSGSPYISHFVVGRLAEAAGCPVYGISDTLMDSGIVGGAMTPIYRQGQAAGVTLTALLGRRNAVVALDATRVDPVLQVDERRMVKWRLSEHNLPDGYEVVNKAPSLWRDYRKQVLGALLFFLAQAGLISWLLVQVRSRKIAERKLRGTFEVLEGKQEELSRARDAQDRALEGLRDSEATLQSILSAIPVGVLMIDMESGTVKEGNRAAAELLGRPVEELVGGACPACFEPFLSGEAAGAIDANSSEDAIRTQDGRELSVLKTVDRLSIGGKTYMTGCLLDISARKAAEREAREREEQVVHADKMISIGLMAAGITHEIQNPNNFISLNAPVLKMAWESVLGILDEYADENGDFLIQELPYSRARQHIASLLNGIMEGSERIKNIIRDMREFASEEPSENREEVDINAVLSSSLDLLSVKLRKCTGNLVVEYGEDIPGVAANAQRLAQVVINLILNGAEAAAEGGGSLSIRSYYDIERAKVILVVKDSGRGIQPDQLNRIFDPFFTTKRETGGTGLGLAISQRIVEGYGGRIRISSTVGEGTTAVLEIPACN